MRVFKRFNFDSPDITNFENDLLGALWKVSLLRLSIIALVRFGLFIGYSLFRVALKAVRFFECRISSETDF
jgi:hypothetical protein